MGIIPLCIINNMQDITPLCIIMDKMQGIEVQNEGVYLSYMTEF